MHAAHEPVLSCFINEVSSQSSFHLTLTLLIISAPLSVLHRSHRYCFWVGDHWTRWAPHWDQTLWINSTGSRCYRLGIPEFKEVWSLSLSGLGWWAKGTSYHYSNAIWLPLLLFLIAVRDCRLSVVRSRFPSCHWCKFFGPLPRRDLCNRGPFCPFLPWQNEYTLVSYTAVFKGEWRILS